MIPFHAIRVSSTELHDCTQLCVYETWIIAYFAVSIIIAIAMPVAIIANSCTTNTMSKTYSSPTNTVIASLDHYTTTQDLHRLQRVHHHAHFAQYQSELY